MIALGWLIAWCRLTVHVGVLAFGVLMVGWLRCWFWRYVCWISVWFGCSVVLAASGDWCLLLLVWFAILFSGWLFSRGCYAADFRLCLAGFGIWFFSGWFGFGLIIWWWLVYFWW